jgi:serine/threonine protein kinase
LHVRSFLAAREKCSLAEKRVATTLGSKIDHLPKSITYQGPVGRSAKLGFHPPSRMTLDSNVLARSEGLRAQLGDYRVVAEIGRGGMASVSLALVPDAAGGRRLLVLKQLQAELARDREFRAMFENEARLASRLHHPNVVETSDIYADRDLCVLVMEFLDGQTLARIRQRGGQGATVPFSVHLRVLAEALAGLHYVHEFTDEKGTPLGIVHRDVSPSNIFVTYDGLTKVVDFGIAKATLHQAETRIGVLKGKLAYMSPEVVRNEGLDRRSDIFSVGVMLWEAATGCRFWRGHDELSVFQHLLAGDLPIQSPGGLGRTSGEMLRIAQRALSVDRAQRYATAEEMRLELEPLIAGLGKVAERPALEGYMEANFSADRQKIRAAVGDAVARLPSSSGPRRWLDVTVPSREADPSEAPTRVASPPACEGTLRTAISAYDVFGSGGKPQNLRRGLERAVGMTLAAAAAVLAVAYISRGSVVSQASVIPAPITSASMSPAAEPSSVVKGAAETRQAPEALPAATVSPAVPATSTARSDEILVVFVARPPQARLFLDGDPLKENPVRLQRLPDDKRHALRVEAPGYAPLVRTIELNRDVAKEFELTPEAPRGLAVPKSPSPARDDPWGI